MKVETFIKGLQRFSAPQVFNPWHDYDDDMILAGEEALFGANNCKLI